MKAPNVSLGLDVGGSHVTASVVDMSFTGERSLALVRKEIDSFSAASEIVAAIADCITEALAGREPVAGIGIAFPGPFNYSKGVCTVLHVGGKFERMFGLHLGQALKDATGMCDTAFRFFNDAHCFAVGAYTRSGLESKRTIFLTLGSGFGSSFMENGALVTHHNALPGSGAFYNELFGESIADDYFSTRWFHHAYKQATGQAIKDVRELAEMDSEVSKGIFHEFGANLGRFLLPWLKKFGCDELVIGGNITKAGHLFLNALENQLKSLDSKVRVIFCEDTEACILTGAACLANGQGEASDNAESLDPAFNTDLLVERLRHEKTAAIDGFEVRSWEVVRQKLHAALTAAGRNVLWYDIDACLKTPAADERHLWDGFHSLDDQKMRVLRPDTSADLCIVYGTGAALCGWEGKMVNLDSDLEMKPVC